MRHAGGASLDLRCSIAPAENADTFGPLLKTGFGTMGSRD